MKSRKKSTKSQKKPSSFGFTVKCLAQFIDAGHPEKLTPDERAQFEALLFVIKSGRGDYDSAFFMGFVIGKFLGRERLAEDPKLLASRLGKIGRSKTRYKSLDWNRIVEHKLANPQLKSAELMEFAKKNGCNVTSNLVSFERHLRERMRVNGGSSKPPSLE